MKNIYIIILVVLVVGVLFFFSTSNQEEVVESTQTADQMLQENHDTNAQDMVADNVKEFTISGENYSFTPSTIKVKEGDRVKITFENVGGFHDFVIDEFNIATEQANSPATAVVEFVASKTGEFAYYCSVGAHRSLGMEGVLVVE